MLTPCLLSSGQLAACHMHHAPGSCTSFKNFVSFPLKRMGSGGVGWVGFGLVLGERGSHSP